MPKTRILTQQAIPGANLGETFTASIPTRIILPQKGEAYWSDLFLGFRGTLAAATTVALETFLALVNPLIFTANETRISMRARDLFALSLAFYAQPPSGVEGAAATTDKVLGIRIPIWVNPKPNESYGFAITRVAVTNISAETLNLSLGWNSKKSAGGRIDAREIPFTTPGATGITQVTPKLPKVGKLLGLLVFSTTAPTPAADTAGVQHLFLDSPTTRYVSADWGDLQASLESSEDMTRANATEMMLRNVMTNYGWLDFRDDPIDLVAEDVSLSIDAQVVSEAERFIPIIEVPQ